MKSFGLICILCALLVSGCGKSSQGGGSGAPLDVKVKLALNAETPIKDAKLQLKLQAVARDTAPTASVDAKLDTMEILRVLKVGDSFELGEYKVTVTSIDTSDKPSCEVRVIRQ